MIICGLDPRVSLQATQSALALLGKGVRKVALVDFGVEPCIHTALVYFDNIADGKNYLAKDMYTKLRRYEKAQTLGSKMHLIPGALIQTSVRWFCYKVLDPSLEWTAVVCRGIKLLKTAKEIHRRLGKYCLRVEVPRYIFSELCTVIVVPGLLEANKIISHKNLGISEFMDIHPYSSVFKRPDLYMTMFFKEINKAEYTNLSVLPIKDHNDEEMISPISSSEEGEITNGEKPTVEIGYKFFEIAGEFITKSQEISYHSGVLIKTSFNSKLSQFIIN